jgi:hypothetical protein
MTTENLHDSPHENQGDAPRLLLRRETVAGREEIKTQLSIFWRHVRGWEPPA